MDWLWRFMMIVDANFDPSGLPSSASRNWGNTDSTDTVWHCSINDSLLQQPSIVESIACHLPEYERSYIMKYHFEADRKRSLISSLLQRALIQKTFSIAMGEYTIKRTKENKPFLSTGPPNATGYWNYNVSHHGDYVGIACSLHNLVGLDIVDIGTRSNCATSSSEYIRMFAAQLTEYEREFILSAASEDERYTRFFIFWSLKEAYIKAIGLGLGYDLLRVEFRLEDHVGLFSEVDISVMERRVSLFGKATVIVDGQMRSDWLIQYWSVDERHVVSLAHGPLSEALPSYRSAVWGLTDSSDDATLATSHCPPHHSQPSKSLTSVPNEDGIMCVSQQISVQELLDIIGIHL